MGRIGVCTTFSPAGYELYGKRFIDSFVRYWPEDIPLWAFVEGEDQIEPHPQVEAWDLNRDNERTEFLHYCALTYPEHPTNYRFQARKFCHKVFAYTSMVGKVYDWWVFIDADVFTHSSVTEEWLARLLDPKADVLYLGRPEGRHSETGFLAFHTKRPMARAVLQAMRQYYTHHLIFKLKEWHDAWVFDQVRKDSVKGKFVNLAKEKSGHVWPTSILGEVMTHNKGPKRKTSAYGGAL